MIFEENSIYNKIANLILVGLLLSSILLLIKVKPSFIRKRAIYIKEEFILYTRKKVGKYKSIAIKKDYKILYKFIKKVEEKVSIDAKNREGKTMLIQAVERNNIIKSKQLIAQGANIRIKDKKGKTALDYAYKNRNRSLIRFLKQHGAFTTKYIPERFLEHNQVTKVKKSINTGANLNLKYKFGITALMIAASADSLDVARLLIEKGASLNTKDKDGWTALDFAEQKGNKKMIELLRLEQIKRKWRRIKK